MSQQNLGVNFDMDYIIQLSNIVQIDRRKWLLVVGLVAVTHMFCQSLMLPYGTALRSLLPRDKFPIHEELRFTSQESAVKTLMVDDSLSDNLPNLIEETLFSHRIKRTNANNEASGIGRTEIVKSENVGKENDVLFERKAVDSSLDFVEDANFDNDMPFEEVADVDDDGLLENDNGKTGNGLSLEQAVRPSDHILMRYMPEARINVTTEHATPTNVLLSSTAATFAPMDLLVNRPKQNHVQVQSSTAAIVKNNSASLLNPIKKKMRCEMPPKTVTSIHEMEKLLIRNRARSRAMKPRWSSERDQEIFSAKIQIENAPSLKSSELYAPLYRNVSTFKRSYELMERMLKIYVYKDGEKPIFHQPILKGLYASEGWFMKLMEGNRHFGVKDPRRAHLYYMPFSSRMLEYTLYVRNSHNRTNLRQYLKDYSERIAAKYRFWNRTGGADHFLVACHDWAPYETRHHMEHCMKALCNADVTMGFKIGRDVSLPETYVRSARNPLRDLGGKPPSQRYILAFYAGSIHGYLRPILLQHWKDKDPDMKIFSRMPAGVASKMNYIQHMKSSKYCICPKGYEVNSPRVVEAIFYECVPVIISDNFVPPFFEILNWDSFSVILAEKDIPKLKEILISIPEERYLKMQLAVKKVQQHFLWHAKPVKYDLFHMTLHSIWYNRVFQTKLR